MDDLDTKKRIRPETRVNLVADRRVVVAPRDAKESEVPFTVEGFAKVLGSDGRLAAGEVNSVPVGTYAKDAMIAVDGSAAGGGLHPGPRRRVRPGSACTPNARIPAAAPPPRPLRRRAVASRA